jgi:hypothetical protein
MTKRRKARATPKRRKAPAATGSVVPSKYREQYKEHGGSSGDDLAVRLKKHVAADDGSIDLAKLRKLAEANGVWDERYNKLNAGLARMTCGNKLRALVRHGAKIKWAVVLLALLLLAPSDRAAAQPLPQPKIGQCPSGYTQSGGFCAPMVGTDRNATPKTGQCPANWVQSGAYCLSPARGRQR